MRTAYIYDDIYLYHNTGAGHPECSDRMASINGQVKGIKDKLVYLKPIKASEKIVNLVHPFSHIETLKKACESEMAIDADTKTSCGSYDAALSAVGAAVVAIDSFEKGEIDGAFAAVRPPGHHCETNRAMGFCLFNNVAIAARYAQQQGYKKVLIIDFDVHHGNGTQEIFYDDESVFYFGSHQAFAYPGTGGESEKGEGKGYGYTQNHPLMPNSSDKDILEIYQDDMPRCAQEFDPDIILVSAGYDLHESDPLASLDVTTEGIGKIVESIVNLKSVPYLFMLEGGYDLSALGKNVKITLEKMIKR